MIPRVFRILLPFAAVLSAALARSEEAQPFFFIQLADPQFGMYAKDADFAQETANFEFAIATVNRLKPAFVVVSGDLVNKTGDAAQCDEYLRIVGKLDRSIRLYQMPGNHDVGNLPTPETLAAYTARFGPDHYSFRHGNMAGIVLNSEIIHDPKHVAKQVAEQEAWLKEELAKAKKDNVRHVVVFQHHCWFFKTADEADTYENIPLAERTKYLDLFRQHGVKFSFAGHHHGNQIARDGDFEMVTTCAIGQPLRKDGSGLRVVIVRGDRIEHRYYEMGRVPNKIDLTDK
jgi:3',5'-cyclic AMP phosphodiesterase CpdA